MSRKAVAAALPDNFYRFLSRDAVVDAFPDNFCRFLSREAVDATFLDNFCGFLSRTAVDAALLDSFRHFLSGGGGKDSRPGTKNCGFGPGTTYGRVGNGLAVLGLVAGAVYLVVELGVRHVGAAGALLHEGHKILEISLVDVAGKELLANAHAGGKAHHFAHHGTGTHDAH